MANDEELDPVEQVFLHAYPNPNRIGCPGTGVIRAIAKNTLPLEHSAREHLAKCSPCYAEFKQFQRQITKRAARLRVVGGIAALLAVAVLSWALLVIKRRESLVPDHQLRTAAPAATGRPDASGGNEASPKRPPSPAPDSRPTTVAVLNLEGLSRSRGMTDERVQPELQSLPTNARVALSIYLPLGSDEGQYELRLLRNPEQIEQPLRMYQGKATIENGLTVLPLIADFSGLEAGTYVLAFRRNHESWRFGRVALAAPRPNSRPTLQR